MKTDLDLYTDALISPIGQTSATGLSALLGTTVSHKAGTCFLNQLGYDSKAQWKQVKRDVHRMG